MSIEDHRYTLDEYFEGHADSRQIFDSARNMIIAIGLAEVRVTKSQVAFWRRKAFAWTWMPGKYLQRNTAPLVLTVALRRRDSSPRWKQIVEPRPGRFTHHLELHSVSDVDDQVRDWLRDAWMGAA